MKEIRYESNYMSIEKLAFTGASWLAWFKLLSQIFSWTITVVVARILSPDDYGLMSMATILTGYASIFSELGLGSAIIQKQNISPADKELSSVFWFSLGLGIFFALLCFVLAYPTAYIFDEERVIPITQAVSLIFLANSLAIVPFNLLKKELNFRKVGYIEMVSVFISGACMLVIAKSGGGVWTLIGGHIVRNFVKLGMTYYYAKWNPSLHYNYREASAYLKFGINVSIGSSMSYVNTKSDSFFAGRVWSAETLGYYSLALQLSTIPTDKIVTLINQVSYSALSMLQTDKENFKRFYLNVVKITSLIAVPLFVMGWMLGEDLITILLGEKWKPIVYVFQYLCLAQIIVSINAINNFVHNALGNPHLSLRFNAICMMFIPVSFYFAAQYGLHAIVIPWLTTYLVIYVSWILFTISKLGISVPEYLKSLYPAVLATIIMVSIYELYVMMSGLLQLVIWNIYLDFVLKVIISGGIYIATVYILDREIFKKLRTMTAK